jgi:hypothetical protein
VVFYLYKFDANLPMTFDFISDNRFKDLLDKDYNELSVCLNGKASKAVLILAGSIIEASLIEYFLQNIPECVTEPQLLKLSIGELIDLAEKEGLLTQTEKNLATVIRDYRNLIHPGRQIRKNEKYNFDTANIAFRLVNIILDAIRQKHINNANYTSEEIIDKLKNDINFRSIYSDIILKLNQNERKKLLNRLIFYQMENTEDWDAFLPEGVFQLNHPPPFHELYDIKPIINDLKPLIQSEGILEKLNELVKEIERGSKHRAYAIFNLFHEDIDRLPGKSQEMIAIYFLFFYSSISDNTKVLCRDKTYSTIGRYIHTDKGISAFNKFVEFCVNNFSKNNIVEEMDLFEQAYNSLAEDNKRKVYTYLIDKLKGSNPSILVITGFIDGAIARKLFSEDEISYSNFTRPKGRG